MGVLPLLLILVFLIVIKINYEQFKDYKSDYPCRVYLSDSDFI